MNDLVDWNHRLLFASLTIILGVVGFAGSHRSEDRRLLCSVFLQGLLLLFVIGGAYFRNSSELHLGGLVIVSWLILQGLITSSSNVEADPSNGDNSE